MLAGLNMQTDRQIRYKNREHKQKIKQQNLDRTKRLEKRRCNIIHKVGKETTNEIMEDITKEIDDITIKKKQFEHRYPTRISTKNSFFL